MICHILLDLSVYRSDSHFLFQTPYVLYDKHLSISQNSRRWQIIKIPTLPQSQMYGYSRPSQHIADNNAIAVLLDLRPAPPESCPCRGLPLSGSRAAPDRALARPALAPREACRPRRRSTTTTVEAPPRCTNARAISANGTTATAPRKW